MCKCIYNLPTGFCCFSSIACIICGASHFIRSLGVRLFVQLAPMILYCHCLFLLHGQICNVKLHCSVNKEMYTPTMFFALFSIDCHITAPFHLNLSICFPSCSSSQVLCEHFEVVLLWTDHRGVGNVL